MENSVASQSTILDKEKLAKKREEALKAINERKPKPSFISKFTRFLAGGVITTAIGGTAANQVGVENPAGDAVESAVHESIDTVAKGATGLTEIPGNTNEAVKVLTVDQITENHSTEIKHYNETFDQKLSGQTPLSEGEKILHNIRIIVPSGNTFEDQQNVKTVSVYPAPFSVAGVNEPVGTVDLGYIYAGNVLVVDGLIRPHSRDQKIPYAYLKNAKYKDSSGIEKTGDIWVEGDNVEEENPHGPNIPVNY